jgi:hypothetical protein
MPPARFIEKFDDRERLREHMAIDLQRRHKALRIAHQMIGAFVLTGQQIDVNALKIDPHKTQRDA